MASESMHSPFGGSQSTVSSPNSDETTPSPALAVMERLRSTLPTEEAATPAHVPEKKHRMRFPSLSSPRTTHKAKRSNGMLTLLRKPKPKWDDLKNKLRHRHGRHESDTAESRDSASEQQDGENGNDEQDGLKEEGCQLESQVSMMPDVLKPGQDLHVQVVSAKGLRAADSNGLSDPYTVVHLGSRTDQTRVIQENLSPEWHETFVYSADDIQSALMDHMSSLLFEVWDSDFGLVADDFLGQAEFSLLDFKVTDESSKVELPLFIEVKGKRIESGVGSLTLLLWVTEQNADAGDDGAAPSIVSTVCPTMDVPKQLPSLVHDERGNTLFEEPAIAWMHIRISQVALVRHAREEDGLHALAKIFVPPKSRSRWKGWSLKRNSDPQSNSFTEPTAPRMHETLKPSPTFKERRTLRRVISDDKESLDKKDDRGTFKNVKRKVKHLFGKSDKEEEDQAADFLEDDELGPLEEEEEERAEKKEQDKVGPTDEELEDEQLLYWEVSMGSQQHRSRLAPLSSSRNIAQWDQDFAFAVVLPLKTRPLMLELHESKGGRRKGRTIARAYIPLADLFPSGKSEFGADVEWFKLHDVGRRASGEVEAAVCLAVACVDIDKRRAIYDLPLAVAPEKRVTKGQLEKVSAQKSEESFSSQQRGDSFSSQQRPRETSGVTQEPAAEQGRPEPQTFKEKVVDKLQGLSIMPKPEQALESLREESRDEMNAAMSRNLGEQSPSKGGSSSQLAKEPSSSQAGASEVAQDKRPVLPHGGKDDSTVRAAAEQQAAKESEQALQEHSASADAGDKDAGSVARAAAEPLSWGTRIAQKLFIKKPKWDKPAPLQALGIVQLHIKEVELETSEACFLLLRCGAQWGRTIMMPSSKNHNFNWEVHMPVLEPSTLLQLALFKETGPRGSRKAVLVGLLRLRLNSLTSEVDHAAELPMCSSRKQGGEKTATVGVNIKVTYFNKWRLLRTYALPAAPLGLYKHGLNKGDVKQTLDRETNRIIMRWLETSNPPVPRAVADVLIRSPQDTFAMSRVKANWRRIATWFDGFKKAGEGWKYLQTWENPAATIGTMAGLTSICCFPHMMVSLALTGLIIFMVVAYPKNDVGKPLPMEPDPEAEEDEDDEDNELQGTLVTRLQRKMDGMQKIALKVQNVLDDVASILEQCRGLVCWADPNASAFFLLIGTAWALGIAVLGLHTVISFLLCWMLRPPFLRVPKPPPPVSFIGRLPTKADQIT